MKSRAKSILLNAALLAIAVAAGITLGRYVPKLHELTRSHGKSGDFAQHVSNMPYKVTLYGTSTCPHCKNAREYLRKMHVGFNDVLIDQSPAANKAFSQLGEKGVPVLVTEHRLIVGFAQSEYNDLLKP
jgi:glutaredoxin